MPIKISIAICVALVLCATPLPAAPLAVVDQQNLIADGRYFSGQSIIGQTFVPSLSAIDAFEVDLGALTGGNRIYLNLRDGLAGANGLGGPILGTTNAIVLPSEAPNELRHFDFPSRIPLTSGRTYVIEVVGENGQQGGVSFDDRYPAGEGLVIFSAGRDMVFAEGLHVPEPGTLIMAMTGIAALGSIAVGRRPRER